MQSLLRSMGERSDWSPIWITIYKLTHYRSSGIATDAFCSPATLRTWCLYSVFVARIQESTMPDNLAWKLAFVVKGLASDRLLDTFSDERVFALQQNLSYGTKSTEFMAPPSFAFELMRHAVLSLR